MVHAPKQKFAGLNSWSLAEKAIRVMQLKRSRGTLEIVDSYNVGDDSCKSPFELNSEPSE